jgi:hypothetical protein
MLVELVHMMETVGLDTQQTEVGIRTLRDSAYDGDGRP